MGFPASFWSSPSGPRRYGASAPPRSPFIVGRIFSGAGFTLIELLIVLAIIAVLAGVFGSALGGNRETVALQAAQRNFSGLLIAARAQARMHSVPTRVVIDNDPLSPDYLQRAWIVREAGQIVVEGRSVTNWKSAGSGVGFRRGVFLVPPAENTPPEMFANYDDPGKRKSNGARAEMFIDGEETKVIYYGFNTRGALSGVIGRVVIAPARVTPSGIVFENSERVVGMHLREYGTVTIVNDTTGFD